MNKLILLADDDAEIRNLIQQCLEQNDYDVFYAIDGAEAIRILKTIAVDMVITDIKMPRKGGIELANEIKTSYPDVKVIGITGGDLDPSMIESAENINENTFFHGFLQKPFNFKELIEKVDQLIK